MFRQQLKILLSPGIGLKRWLAVFALGVALSGLGIGFAMVEPISPRVLPVLRILTLSGVDPIVRGLVFILTGSILTTLGLTQTYRVLMAGAVLGRGKIDVLTALDRKRRIGQGVRIVAIGGGTGLSALLRGLKHKTSNLTAIVTIADDGGSSGRLRTDLQIPPPGDARSCLVALSETEPLLEELFRYRFVKGASLDGHSLGNLLLAALYDIRGGFHESLEAAAQLLGLHGQVVPVSTKNDLVLMGETVSGQILSGEWSVGHAPDLLKRVWIEPEGSVASEAALHAIRNAEVIVIGPGSLYTSILPNFLLNGVREAIVSSSAPKVFVCNVATQLHETDGFGVTDHIHVFEEVSGIHTTHILINSNVEELPTDWGQKAISPEHELGSYRGAVILANVVDEAIRTRHDSEKLSEAILSIARL